MRLITQGEKEEDLQLLLNNEYEIGIDEVGRGSIFGPVFSSVVVLTKKNRENEVRKQRRREKH